LKFLIIPILVLILAIPPVLAQETEIKYQIQPEKIHEGDTVTLEVYLAKNNQVLLSKIPEIEIETLDSGIIQINSDEKKHKYKKIIKLDAIKDGETSIYLHIEGKGSLEVPIEIFGDIKEAQKLTMDVFPDNLHLDANNEGVLFLTLTDSNGTPTKAKNDRLVKLSTSKPEIVSLSQTDVIIPMGESNIKILLEGVKEGETTITAKTGDFRTSSTVSVLDDSEETIEIFVIPEQINSFQTANGHIIAQYYKEGELSPAPKDIVVHYKIKSENEAVNSSTNLNEINPVGYFQISKGSAWGHTKFSIQEGVTNSYDMTVTTQDPLSVTEIPFETISTELFDDGEIKFSSIPVLADGKKQLAGVLYLEDKNQHPVIANKDITIPFATSENTAQIENAIIKKGEHSTLVFGKIESFSTESISITPLTEKPTIEQLEVYGKEKDETVFTEFTPISDLIDGNTFWTVIYLESSSGEIIPFPQSNIVISDENNVKVNIENIEKYPYFVLVPLEATESDIGSISLSILNFDLVIPVEGISTKPDQIVLNHPDELFVGMSDTFTIQALSDKGSPTNLQESIDLKVFSSDPSILTLPKDLKIVENSNFVIFDVIPVGKGEVDISVISEGFPIVTENILISEVKPEIKITSHDIVNQDDSLIVSVLATQNGFPLKNSKVEWNVEGGFSTALEEKTSPSGEAIASLIPTSDEKIKVDIVVTNDMGITAKDSKSIKVNATQQIEEEVKEETVEKPTILGIDPVLIMIPAIVGTAVVYMKKKSKKT